MTDLSFSIAMATFNGASFLKKQLDSLAGQRCAPRELVVCDDRSVDATIEILESFATLAPFPVRIVVNDERLGYKANFMKAASLCTGSVIAFCDQDDIWESEKICALAEAFRDVECLVVSHDFSVLFMDGRQAIPSYFERLEQGGFSRAVGIKGCTMAFRRELIEHTGWPKAASGWSHDAWIALIATALNRRAYIDRPLIKHRIHGSNASGWLVGRTGIARLISRINIPPFTSSEDIDGLVDLCFDDDSVDELAVALSRPALALNQDRRAYVVKSLQKKVRMKSFRGAAGYIRFPHRAFAAIRLFVGLNYTVGGGLSGFISDIAGRRQRRR